MSSGHSSLCLLAQPPYTWIHSPVGTPSPYDGGMAAKAPPDTCLPPKPKGKSDLPFQA